MPEHYPESLSALFMFLVIVLIWQFQKAARLPRYALWALLFWLGLSGSLAAGGFFLPTDALPPNFLFLILPPFLVIAGLLLLPRGRAFIRQTDPRALTWIHSSRIIVEIYFYSLFLHGLMPKIMTFEGRNMDILIGLSAIPVAWYGYHKKILSQNLIRIWNVVGMLVLGFTVFHGIFSAPFPWQKFGFDQPNVSLVYLPFCWVPGLIVPMVIFSHIACLFRRQTPIS